MSGKTTMVPWFTESGQTTLSGILLSSVDYRFPPNILTTEKTLSTPPSQGPPIPFD